MEIKKILKCLALGLMISFCFLIIPYAQAMEENHKKLEKMYGFVLDDCKIKIKLDGENRCIAVYPK